MLRALLPALAALVLILAACDSAEESVADPTPPRIGEIITPRPGAGTSSGTPWPALGSASEVGTTTYVGSGGYLQPTNDVPCPDNPVTPTPELLALCDSTPNPGLAQLGKLVPVLSEPPAPPPFRAVTDYFDFGETVPLYGISVTMAAPLKYEVPDGYSLRFFEYLDGEWVDLKPAQLDGHDATAAFDPWPSNLIVLAVPE